MGSDRRMSAESATEEREALAAIYGEQFAYSPAQRTVTVRLDVEHGTAILRDAVALHVELAEDYPASPPVQWWLDDVFQLMTLDDEHRLSESLALAVANAGPGAVVLFRWIEALREALFLVADRAAALLASSEPDAREAASANEPATAYDDEADAPRDSSGNALEHVTYKPYVKGPARASSEPPPAPPPIHHGELLEDRKSVFQAHLCTVKSVKEVHDVMAALLADRKVARATHNIMAYRIALPGGALAQSNDDDGEDAAGGRLAHLLELVGATDVVVVVSRWYGGIQLGPDRFRHINNVARTLLDAHGYVNHGGKKAKGKR